MFWQFKSSHPANLDVPYYSYGIHKTFANQPVSIDVVIFLGQLPADCGLPLPLVSIFAGGLRQERCGGGGCDAVIAPLFGPGRGINYRVTSQSRIALHPLYSQLWSLQVCSGKPHWKLAQSHSWQDFLQVVISVKLEPVFRPRWHLMKNT